MTTKLKNLITDKADQRKRIEEKRSRVLRWLSGEIYTDAQIIADLLGVQKNAATKTLAAMERDGLLRSEQVPGGFSIITAWGLTPHGALMAQEPGSTSFNYFEAGRISALTINHTLQVQRVRLHLEREGWQNWQTDRDLHRSGAKLLKIPDGIAVDPEGQRIAVEVELTSKTPKRYGDIVSAYLRMVKEKQIDCVHYFCPVGMAARLEGLFRGIRAIKFQGQIYQLNEEHHARFKFFQLPGAHK